MCVNTIDCHSHVITKLYVNNDLLFSSSYDKVTFIYFFAKVNGNAHSISSISYTVYDILYIIYSIYSLYIIYDILLLIIKTRCKWLTDF